MIVVSNTSPLINLANIGQLHLLQQLYGQVIIPPAVYDEIVLALELKSDLLLLDERKGRQVASNLGIRFTGILGILIEAKNNKLINYIKLLMDDLIKQVGFRVSSKLYQRVLQIADE